MRCRFWGSAVVLVLLVAVGASSLAQGAVTVAVQPGESIQAAIDAAPEGAVILLAAGEWQEPLTITKSLTLRGEGPDKTTIRGQERDIALIKASNPGGQKALVVIQGLSAIGSRRSLWLDGTLHATVMDATVSGSAGTYGIYIDGAVRVTVLNSSVVANDEFGIAVADSAQATIVACTIGNNGTTGIGLLGSSQATIANCAINGHPQGIWVTDNGRATVIGGTSSNNGTGVSLRSSGQATVAGCTIVGATGSGVLLQAGAQITMNGCTVSSCNAGVNLQGHAAAFVAGCTIASSTTYGVGLQESAQATIVGNEIVENGMAGLRLLERPCVATSDVFKGRVAGRDNLIPGPTDPMGNVSAGVCPDVLLFLTTKEGGQLDRRPTP